MLSKKERDIIETARKIIFSHKGSSRSDLGLGRKETEQTIRNLQEICRTADAGKGKGTSKSPYKAC